MAAKTSFWYCSNSAIMLIYVNYRENDGVDLNLFHVKRSVSDSLTNRKNNGQKRASESSEMREKQILGP